MSGYCMKRAGPMRRRHGRPASTKALKLWVALVVTAFVATGCGGGQDGKREGKPAPDSTTAGRKGGSPVNVDEARACRLVTEADVEAALGAQVKAPVTGRGVEGCSFVLASGPGQVLVFSSEAADNGASFDAVRNSTPGGVETLPGLGDRAFLVGSQAYVLKGAVMVVIAVEVKQPEAKLKQVARQLAGVAAKRM